MWTMDAQESMSKKVLRKTVFEDERDMSKECGNS